MPNGKDEHYLQLTPHTKKCKGRYAGKNKPARKKIRQVSKKMREKMKIYAKLRKEFLSARPVDKLWCIRNGWEYGGDGRYYEPAEFPRRGIADVGLSGEELIERLGAPRATTIHHGMRRGKYLLDVSTWHELSMDSHRWVESHPAEAEKLGLLHPDRNRR